MKKKKVIATIIIIIAVGLLVAGGILIYQNYSNKNRIITSFNELKTALEETLNLNKEDESTSIKQTVTGSTTFNINTMLGNSEDGTDVIINNLNSSTFNYEYRLDTESKRMYLDGSLLLNNIEMLGINFYQAEDISYVFLRNIFDKYIVIEDSDIFSYLEENKTTKEDINYIYDKIIESLGNNVTTDDIKVTSVDGKKKISLELNEKRLNEISKVIIDDLKKDNKAKEILGENLNNLDTSTETTKNNNNNNYISYSIYLDKGSITTYEFGLNNDDTNYNIEFNNGNEKNIIIKENDVEALKGIIRKNNDNTTIELSSDNINLGTITINDNNININIILDEATNTTITADITSSTSDNNIITNFNMALSSNGRNMDIIKVTDTKQITENAADFSNINPTNNVDINSLTEEDLTTIENNLMTIFYNFMGIAM